MKSDMAVKGEYDEKVGGVWNEKSAKQTVSRFLCPEQDSNLHAL